MKPRKFKHYIKRFAARLAGLSAGQRATMAQLLNARVRQDETAALIEAAAPPACPRCQCTRVHRHGQAHGLQRNRCADCGRTFNALTGTPLARLRHRARWLAYLDCMLASRTVRGAAAATGVHKNTSFRWRHRFLTVAKHDRDWPLCGITEADETYLLESQKGSRHLDRPARRRGGSAHRRGISHQHVCILVARDRGGRTFDFVTGRAPLTRHHLRRCLAAAIERDILLVTDGHPAYRLFARASGIAHSALNLAAGVRVVGELHVQNVNAYHSRFKQWLRRFHGVASRYLANYLGWQWALDGGRIGSPEMLLRAALGRFPHLTVT